MKALTTTLALCLAPLSMAMAQDDATPDDRQSLRMFAISALGANFLSLPSTRADGVTEVSRWVFFPDAREISGKRYNTIRHTVEVNCADHAMRSTSVSVYWAELFGPDQSSHHVSTEVSNGAMARAEDDSIADTMVDLACGEVAQTRHPQLDSIIRARAYGLIMLATTYS